MENKDNAPSFSVHFHAACHKTLNSGQIWGGGTLPEGGWDKSFKMPLGIANFFGLFVCTGRAGKTRQNNLNNCCE